MFLMGFVSSDPKQKTETIKKEGIKGENNNKN